MEQMLDLDPAAAPDQRRLGRRLACGLALAAMIAPRLARASPPNDVSMPIHQLYDALLALMRMGTATPFRERYDRLGPVIDRVFDLSTVLRTSVGMRWGALGGP